MKKSDRNLPCKSGLLSALKEQRKILDTKQWCQDPHAPAYAILQGKLNSKDHCSKRGDHTDPRKISWASGGGVG